MQFLTEPLWIYWKLFTPLNIPLHLRRFLEQNDPSLRLVYHP